MKLISMTDFEFKGTKGKWSYSKQKGIKNHCFQAQVWNENGDSMAIIEPTDNEYEASANALLISKAPEMLEMLQYFVDNNMLSVVGEEIAKQLIKEATEL